LDPVPAVSPALAYAVKDPEAPFADQRATMGEPQQDMTMAQVVEKMPAVRQAIACMLKTLCAAPHDRGDLDNTHAVWIALTEPGIPLLDYALRLQTYMHCSASCVVSSIIYIDRLIQLGGNIVIHPRTIHRLLLTAMVVSTKYWDDEFYKNSYYARVGGLPVVELNKLEADLCFELNFELSVDPRLFAQYYHELAKHSMMNKCPNCNPSLRDVPSPPTTHSAEPPAKEEAPSSPVAATGKERASDSDEQLLDDVDDEVNDAMEAMDTNDDDRRYNQNDDRHSKQRPSFTDPTTRLEVLTLTPQQAPSTRIPGLNRSFGGSVSSRISMEENHRQVHSPSPLAQFIAALFKIQCAWTTTLKFTEPDLGHGGVPAAQQQLPQQLSHEQ
jgi:hypothetical protein